MPNATMRAVVIHRHGGPDVLTLERAWPRPVAGAGEIVVEVHACALNYLDIFTREGMPGEPTPLPHITGGDVAGIVSEVGSGVTRPKVGDRVLLDPAWGCGVCEYCRAGETTRCLRMHMLGELDKLEANLGGVVDMRRVPDALFVVDLRKEEIGVREARRLGLPIVALVDTNCDPDEADYVIPGNDDAIRACELVTRVLADGLGAGRSQATAREFEQPAEAAAADVEAEPAPEVAAPGVAVDAPPEYEQVAPREHTEAVEVAAGEPEEAGAAE
jgi:hypothetical protein